MQGGQDSRADSPPITYLYTRRHPKSTAHAPAGSAIQTAPMSKSDFYTRYKPLRNFLRQCDLEHSVRDLWAMSRYIFDRTAPGLQLHGKPPNVKLKDYVFPWDVLTYAKEVILHATPGGPKRLDSFASVRFLANSVKQLENYAAQLRNEPDNVLAELHRIGHRQFPLQSHDDERALLRYLKVFGTTDVQSILRDTTGLGIREFYFLGMAIGGHLMQRFDVNADQDYSYFGIDRRRSTAFFRMLSRPVARMREDIEEVQVYDPDWEYAWNPLEAHPMVALDPMHPNRLYCPIPALLLKRVSRGLYYDMVKAKGFTTPFGDAFQRYVGEILSTVFVGSAFSVHAESPYYIGKDLHHGADWILSGPDANLFIECKTKRMRQDAKFSLTGPSLVEEIGKIADAVVQLYKNIQDAEDGHANWKPNGLPNYPVVVTLEDWYLFGPLPQGYLKETLAERMRRTGLQEGLLHSKPYAVASARELEMLAPVVRSVGVDKFFRQKGTTDYRHWMLDAFARECFPDVPRGNIARMFRAEWRGIFPEEALPESAVSSAE